MTDANVAAGWSGATYPTIVPATHSSSVAHHSAVESLEDSAKVEGRITYPLVVGGAAKP